MQSYAHNKGNYVYVRRKRTRSVEVRRADNLHPHPSSCLSPEERILHYVGEERTRVCRCHDPGRHAERTSTVACESRHLSASIMLYLNRHGLDSCAFADFREYRTRREAKWAMEGVHVEDFHYTSQDKDFVCRCLQPRKHSYSAPRHPEIVEQCAEFFCTHKDRNTVTKDQWKGVNGDTPPAYSASVDLKIDYVRRSRPSSSGHAGEKAKPRASLETVMRDTAERIASNIPGRRRRASTPAREPEMPPQVWQKARPSILVSRPENSSRDSTPMGSAPPSTRAVSPAVSYRLAQRADSMFNASSVYAGAQATMGMFPGSHPDPSAPRTGKMLDVTGLYTNRAYLPTSANTSVVSGQSSDGTIKSSGSSPFGYDEWYQSNPPDWVYEKDSEQLLPSTFYVNGDRSNSYGLNASAAHRPVAELPARRSPVELSARRSPVELPGRPARQRHTATLKKLEGRTSDTISELEAKAKRFSVRCTETPPSTSNPAHETARLSSRFHQASNITLSSLPNQEDFLPRYAVPNSWNDPTPTGSCQLCFKSYHNAEKNPVIAPPCGCSMHDRCLMDNLRTLDEKVGRCPICQVYLCKRSLTERIGNDIEQIFELQVIPLREELTLEFPQRSKGIICSTEEGVAVTQLRLLKDYVDVHAEEIFRLWEGNRAEPDWFGGVVRPAVQLFQGWNPAMRSRFFSNEDAFLKLLAWAELARLMNISCAKKKRSQGTDAQFPRLGELHRKFLKAVERYNKEKMSWDTSHSGVYEHDRIAMDAVEIAMNTQVP